MLNDIFARRYDRIQLRDSFEQRDQRLLVQSFRILADDIYPYYVDGKEASWNVAAWKKLHAQLSRELGLRELSKQSVSYTAKWNGKDTLQTSAYTMLQVCENWFMEPVAGSPDTHIKERLSLIELAFREREAAIAAKEARPINDVEKLLVSLNRQVGKLPGDHDQAVRELREERRAEFRAWVEELNTRFRQADYPFHYHNGFIQISTDELVQKEIETPFWLCASDALWKNVDLDMKQALDLRDSDGPDPAFYAARALESTIKIISEKRGWTRGNERGAHSYIDNLASKANAYITQWESTCLKEFFTHVRNPFGHGAGSAEMPSLSRLQTEWAIEFSMSWIKNLARRL